MSSFKEQLARFAQPEMEKEAPTTYSRLVALVAKIGDVDTEAVKYEARLVDDLHFSSLDLVELAVLIEMEFGLEITDALRDALLRDATLCTLVGAIDR